MDLREYSEQIQLKLKTSEDESLLQIIAGVDSLADLYSEIQDSTHILLNIEEILFKFETGLGNIGTEIKSLQNQSLNMNIGINNRKELDNKLKVYISQVMLSQDLIVKLDKEIDENYVSYVNQLKEKLKYIKTQGKIKVGAKDITPPSMQDVIPVLRNIAEKVT